MKAFSPGLSDSLAGVIADAQPCSHCDSSSHIAGGLCVGCLLQAGLDPDDDCEPEALTSAFAEISLPDKNWRLGNYEILEEIGRGGMGVIYRARQRHSRRIVAVKRVLSYHSDSRETLARFRREAQAAASLDHPNILPIYEVSESEDGLPFFSMKFAPGGSLQEVGPALRNETRQCVALVAKIARAVQYAHGKGILHRDLKPGNILLDGRGEPLVSDFGLAKWLDTASDLTRTLTIFGTPGYIAPEQASGAAAQLKPAADVYSLGAILFDLLAGRPPFLGSHALSVIRQAAESPAPKLRTLSKIADRDLETICAHCLEREPSARYPSAHDLAEDLEHWLEGRPIIARPVSPPTHVWRWSRRNPVLTAAVTACLALSVVAGVGLISNSRLGTVLRNHEIARHSVVVTPFEDLDALSTTSAQAREVTRALTDGLQQQKALRISSTVPRFGETADFWKPEDWRRVGAMMGVRKILTGTVRQRNGKQRIVLRVIDGGSGAVVARKISELDSPTSGFIPVTMNALAELRAVLDEIPRGKENSDSTPLHPNPAAREYLATGKEYFNRYTPADTKTSQYYFDKALAADPQCAEAQAMFAFSWARRLQQSPDEFSEENYEKSVAAAAAAIRLDPELALGYRAQAALFGWKDVAQSQEPALCALELEPENVQIAGLIGMAWRMQGRPELALRWLQRSATRGQRPGMNAAAIGDALTDMQQDESAEQAYNQRLEFWPDVPDAHVGLALLLMYHGDFPSARKKCEEALARYPDHVYPRQMFGIVTLFGRDFGTAETEYRKLVQRDRKGGTAFYCCTSNLSALGFLRMQAGDVLEAEKLLAEDIGNQTAALAKAPKNRERLYDLAASHAVLGRREECFEILDRACGAGWIDYRALSIDPRFDSVRGDQRFTTVLNELAQKTATLREGNQPVAELAQNRK
jgi:serine/threonine protein kinase/tetratricopeptide (TPR) repeat protein